MSLGSAENGRRSWPGWSPAGRPGRARPPPQASIPVPALVLPALRFAPGPLLRKEDFLEQHLDGVRWRMYIVQNVDESYPFEPRCRGEVRSSLRSAPGCEPDGGSRFGAHGERCRGPGRLGAALALGVRLAAAYLEPQRLPLSVSAWSEGCSRPCTRGRRTQLQVGAYMWFRIDDLPHNAAKNSEGFYDINLQRRLKFFGVWEFMKPLKRQARHLRGGQGGPGTSTVSGSHRLRWIKSRSKQQAKAELQSRARALMDLPADAEVYPGKSWLEFGVDQEAVMRAFDKAMAAA